MGSGTINHDRETNGTERAGTRNPNFIHRSRDRLSSKSVVRLHSTTLKYRQTGVIVPASMVQRDRDSSAA